MKIEYNNLYTHFVFSTFGRQILIPEKSRIRIEKYITGIVNNNSCKLYAIYANPDHLHFLVSKSPEISDEQLATIIAESSARFINENKFAINNFSWQNSASAFSVSKSDVVIRALRVLYQHCRNDKNIRRADIEGTHAGSVGTRITQDELLAHSTD